MDQGIKSRPIYEPVGLDASGARHLLVVDAAEVPASGLKAERGAFPEVWTVAHDPRNPPSAFMGEAVERHSFRSVSHLFDALKRFRFEAPDGRVLPTAAPGAHIVLSLHGKDRGWRNAYSVVSGPADRRGYEVIVRRVLQSRGGSVHMHEAVQVGDEITALPPHNLFALSLLAHKHVLIGGGIGITPLLAHMASLTAQGMLAFEMHHFCAEAEIPVFEALLAPYAGRAHVHGPGGEAAAIEAILARQRLGTHVYTCGPGPLMGAVTDTAERLGWPAVAVHHESFGNHSAGAPFTAVLARSNLEIQVGETQSLLEAIEDAGVEAPFLCRGGACGQCMTNVLDGDPDHRDDVLTAEERASGKLIMTCVSRAKTPRLVLDL